VSGRHRVLDGGGARDGAAGAGAEAAGGANERAYKAAIEPLSEEDGEDSSPRCVSSSQVFF
jgi:hypothetical protein